MNKYLLKVLLTFIVVLVFNLTTYYLSLYLYRFCAELDSDYYYSIFIKSIESFVYIILFIVGVCLYRFIITKKKHNYNTIDFKVVFIALLFRILISPLIYIDNIIDNKEIIIGQTINTPFSDIFIKFLNLVLLIPIVEELFFRGIVLETIKKKEVYIPVIISSLYFTASHINFVQLDLNHNRLLIFFAMGFITSLIYYKSGIINVIIFHLIYNLTWFFSSVDNTYLRLIKFLDFNFYYWVILFTSLIIFIYLMKSYLYILNKKFYQKLTQSEFNDE